MSFLLLLFGAYLLGSIPFGLLVGRWAKGIDIREYGSKNIGATNVFRTVGKKWGILVLLLDALKGAAACLLPFAIGLENPAVTLKLLLGVTAILGHSFPVWLRFNGGKGVATSLGVFLAACWQPALSTFLVWIIAFVFTHIISVASLSAAVIFPVMVAFFYMGTSDLWILLPVSIALAIFIFYTHRANIQRIRQGSEKKLF